MLGFVALTVIAVCALLAAEVRESRAGIWMAKSLASAGFIGTVLAAGALDSHFGLWVLGALVLCACGDVLLIPRARPWLFQAGVASFGLGHLAFAGAFLLHGFEPRVGVPLALGTGLVGLWALRWLRPHPLPWSISADRCNWRAAFPQSHRSAETIRLKLTFCHFQQTSWFEMDCSD